MVVSGRLAAERYGRQWLVPARALQQALHTRQGRGRPLRPATAWGQVSRLTDEARSGPEALDALRRRLRSRARHLDAYVHPKLLEYLDDRAVLGGRDAAAHAGAPVDVDGERDLYVQASDVKSLIEMLRAKPTIDGANVTLHIVDDEAWSFAPGQRYVDPWVAWLDLADRDDRAADTLLDRLVGGRRRGRS